MRSFTSPACGDAVEVSAGETFAIDFEENPTTGYRWEFTPSEGLEIVSSNYILNREGGVGGGGVRRLLLRSNQPGETRVLGKLWRSWVGDSSSIKRCEITVQAN